MSASDTALMHNLIERLEKLELQIKELMERVQGKELQRSCTARAARPRGRAGSPARAGSAARADDVVYAACRFHMDGAANLYQLEFKVCRGRVPRASGRSVDGCRSPSPDGGSSSHPDRLLISS